MRTISGYELERASRAYDDANGRIHTSRGAVARFAHRGERVELGASQGRYIGTSKSGCQWVAWEGENYLSLCNTFDTQVARERNAPRARFVSRTEQARVARLYREVTHLSNKL